MNEDNQPKTFNVCPVCSHDKTLIQDEVEKEIAKGNLPADAHIPMIATRALLFDPKKAPRILAARMRVPVMLGFVDACSKCGTVRCVLMTKGDAILDTRLGPPSNQPPMPFIGRG